MGAQEDKTETKFFVPPSVNISTHFTNLVYTGPNSLALIPADNSQQCQKNWTIDKFTPDFSLNQLLFITYLFICYLWLQRVAIQPLDEAGTLRGGQLSYQLPHSLGPFGTVVHLLHHLKPAERMVKGQATFQHIGVPKIFYPLY